MEVFGCATKSRPGIPVCDPEKEKCLGCRMACNVMCVRSGEEDTKIPGSVADSSGYHIPARPESDLGP